MYYSLSVRSMMDHSNKALVKYGPLVARILLAALFLLSGLSKIFNFAGTVGYIESVGLPMGAVLAVAAIIIEIAAGLGLVLGFWGRVSALLLMGYTLLATAFFHLNFSDQSQMIAALKNLAVVGGLLYVVMYGTGPKSLTCNCGSGYCPECKGKKKHERTDGQHAQGAEMEM